MFSRSMKIGIIQVPADHDHDPAVVARRAEELGFDSYWLGDHPVVPVDENLLNYPGRWEEGANEPPSLVMRESDPLICLARASAATSTIKLGTGVLLPAERGAILAGSQIGTLDNISGGRLLLGVGTGWNETECVVMGGDWKRRWTQVTEHVAAMKALWTTDPSEFHGKYVDFPPVRSFPKPLSKPHPPVLLASMGSPKVFRRIAEWGDGWIPIVQSAEELAEGVQQMHAAADQVGRRREDLSVTVFGLQGQWRSRSEVEALHRAGAERVVVWLQDVPLDDLLAEMQSLADEFGLLSTAAAKS